MNANEIDLKPGDQQIETGFGTESVDHYFHGIYEFDARSYYDRFFCIIDNDGRIFVSRHVDFFPTTLETKIENTYLFFRESNIDGVGIGNLKHVALGKVRSIGVLKRDIPLAMERLRMLYHEGKCVLVEFRYDPSLSSRLPEQPIHGLIQNHGQGTLDPIFRTPDHDYENVPASNGTTIIPYIGIAALTKCPHKASKS